MSRIKQVASARLGVTPAYRVNAEVLQIKIAQGARPARAAGCLASRPTRLQAGAAEEVIAAVRTNVAIHDSDIRVSTEPLKNRRERRQVIQRFSISRCSAIREQRR